MQLFIMRLVGRFVAKQITVRARIEHRLISLAWKFTERQRDGAVRKLCLDAAHDAADYVNRKRAVLTALHDKGAETERVALTGAVQYLLFGQAVAVASSVGAANTAVIAIVAADIADLNESADVNITAVYAAARSGSLFGGISGKFIALVLDQIFIFLYRQAVLRLQPVDELLCLIHRSAHWNKRF